MSPAQFAKIFRDKKVVEKLLRKLGSRHSHSDTLVVESDERNVVEFGTIDLTSSS